jgi:hypothetical protein
MHRTNLSMDLDASLMQRNRGEFNSAEVARDGNRKPGQELANWNPPGQVTLAGITFDTSTIILMLGVAAASIVGYKLLQKRGII